MALKKPAINYRVPSLRKSHLSQLQATMRLTWLQAKAHWRLIEHSVKGLWTGSDTNGASEDNQHLQLWANISQLKPPMSSTVQETVIFWIAYNWCHSPPGCQSVLSTAAVPCKLAPLVVRYSGSGWLCLLGLSGLCWLWSHFLWFLLWLWCALGSRL